MKHIYIGVIGLIGLLLMGGCSDSHELPGDVPAAEWEVPVSFVVQASGTPGTRAGNNMRPLYTDHILVNVYKRPRGTYANDTVGFTFDQKVGMPCQPTTADDFCRIAEGRLSLQEGYEYRATAIGYARQKDEDKLFSMPAEPKSTFNDAAVTLTDVHQYTTPELFFGTIHRTDATAEALFTYAKDVKLEGWLYRCVAGVELELMGVPAEVTEIALLSGTMNTGSKAHAYDDFLNPEGESNAGWGDRFNKYELAKWVRSDEGEVPATLSGANLLAVTSTLKVRFTKNGVDELATLKLHLEKIEGDNNEGDDDETGLAEGRISFRRNHYYRIKGDFNDLATGKFPLTVTIHPGWEGDADLSLGE